MLPDANNADCKEYTSVIHPMNGPIIENTNLPNKFFTDKTVALMSEEMILLT